MAHSCIKATTLDKILDDRIKVCEAKEDTNLAFWSGYQAALEWVRTQVRVLREFHPSTEE